MRTLQPQCFNLCSLRPCYRALRIWLQSALPRVAMAPLAGTECRPGKEQSRESDAACERGRAPSAGSQVVPKRTKSSRRKSASSFVPAGHKPGLLSDFGGIAGWNAAMRTKEKAGAEARPMQAERYSRTASRGENHTQPCSTGGPLACSTCSPGPAPHAATARSHFLTRPPTPAL